MSERIKKVVNWFLLDKNPPLIKFQGDEDSVVVSEKVISVSNFEKYPIKKGDSVEVSIEGNEVVFLRKENKFAKKTNTTKTETKPAESSASETKELTVTAIYNGESVKFEEENINGKKWTKLSDALKGKDFKSIGLVANNKVKITLVDGVISSVESLTKEAPEAEEKTEAKVSTKKPSYRDEDSTDKRTCVMIAKDIVVALINQGLAEKEGIEKALEDLSKKSYEILSNL